MESWLLALLCFCLFAVGCFLGNSYQLKKTRATKPLNLSVNMKHRLQLLFDSYSDESIDGFIQSLDVTPETLPLHISIGKYFRTQGEVEKAILVHQNLMSHPELSSRASEGIIYELAKDYKAAGLFDRAQALLHQLKDSKQFSVKSLKLLLDIYEAEKDWNSAINEASRIEFKKDKNLALRVSQYYCETADSYLKEGLIRESCSAYKQALSIYKECYRAHFGLSKLAFNNQDYQTAIHHLKLLVSIAPDQIVLALPLLLEVTKVSNSFLSHQQYLFKLLADTGQVPVVLAIVESMREEGALSKASSFLSEYLQQSPSLAVLDCLFKQDLLTDYSSQKMIVLMKRVLTEMHLDEQEYKCTSCGFSGSQVHWLCPSCKSWQTIKPIIEYEAILQK